MKKPSPRVKRLNRKTILHILTGSIAAYKAGDVIKTFREEGARVLCVMTEAAQKFITPLTLRAVSGEEVYCDFFSAQTPYNVLHTALADEVDAVLVAPASANFIARLAAGMADDLASCLVLTARCPIVIAPAMNDQMYTHVLTQRNIETLKGIGYHFIDPVVGHLVCGKEAIGHISDAETIVRYVQNLLLLKNKKRS